VVIVQPGNEIMKIEPGGGWNPRAVAAARSSAAKQPKAATIRRMPFVAVALCLGFVAVLQVSFNRHIALRWGLAPAALLNAGVLTLSALAFYAIARTREVAGFALQQSAALGQFRWWWLLPGLFGFSLVTLLPWAAHHAGVQRVFVGVVAAQMVGSVVWDMLFEKIPLTAPRGVGALLAVASVALVSMK
jgi:transporter family-2 protein